MSFQNEEGIPLVEVKEEEQAKPSYSRYLMALFAAAVLATTAYTSYEAGVSTGMQKVATPMALNKKDAEDGPSAAYHLGLPNDADGPLTNDGAKRQIVHHGFEKYKYLNGKNMAGRFAIPGHGMAQDGKNYLFTLISWLFVNFSFANINFSQIVSPILTVRFPHPSTSWLRGWPCRCYHLCQLFRLRL